MGIIVNPAIIKKYSRGILDLSIFSAINEIINMPPNMGTAIKVSSVAIYSLIIQRPVNAMASIMSISL